MRSRNEKPGQSVCASRFPRGVVILLAVPVLLFTGCSQDHAGVHRGPFAPHPPSMGSTPTIGADLHSVPPGQSIPPAGLGVDLVRDGSEAKHDGATITTNAWGTSQRP